VRPDTATAWRLGRRARIGAGRAGQAEPGRTGPAGWTGRAGRTLCSHGQRGSAGGIARAGDSRSLVLVSAGQNGGRQGAGRGRAGAGQAGLDPGGGVEGSGGVGVGVGVRVGVRVLVCVGVGRAEVRAGVGVADGGCTEVRLTVGRTVGVRRVGGTDVIGDGRDVGSDVTGALVGLFTCRTPGADWAIT
jgi:hypothetical protein